MNWTKRLVVTAGMTVAFGSLAIGPASAAGFDTPGTRVIVPSTACHAVLTAITFGSPLTPVGSCGA